MRIGALVNQTTTMTTNTAQNSLLNTDGTGTIGTVRLSTTGSARYAKVKPAGLTAFVQRSYAL